MRPFVVVVQAPVPGHFANLAQTFGLAWGEAFQISVSDQVTWIRNDLSGDGKADIVLRRTDDDRVVMWEMDGSQKTWYDVGPLPTNREVVGIGDL